MSRVRWESRALNELAALWLQADAAQRQAISADSQSIDQSLRNDPANQVESRSKGRRVFFVPPLGVMFRVEMHAPLVTVLHGWAFRQGPP